VQQIAEQTEGVQITASLNRIRSGYLGALINRVDPLHSSRALCNARPSRYRQAPQNLAGRPSTTGDSPAVTHRPALDPRILIQCTTGPLIISVSARTAGLDSGGFSPKMLGSARVIRLRLAADWPAWPPIGPGREKGRRGDSSFLFLFIFLGLLA
jgi:hypothetical protein